MDKKLVILLLCSLMTACTGNGQKLNKYNVSSVESDVVNMNNQNNIGNILPPPVNKINIARTAGIIK